MGPSALGAALAIAITLVAVPTVWTEPAPPEGASEAPAEEAPQSPVRVEMRMEGRNGGEYDPNRPNHARLNVTAWFDEDGDGSYARMVGRAFVNMSRVEIGGGVSQRTDVKFYRADDSRFHPTTPSAYAEARRIEVVVTVTTDGSPDWDHVVTLSTPLAREP